MNCGNCACRNFTGEEADGYCRSMGARAVSLDTREKWDHFKGVRTKKKFIIKADYDFALLISQVAIQFAERYFWTGGRMNYPDQSYTWPSGVTKRVRNSGDPWSHTGG